MNTSKRIQCFLSSILILWLTACHDSSSSHSSAQPVEAEMSPPEFDFAAVDTQLESFLADNPVFNGASIMIEHRDWGSIHEATFGEQTLDTVLQLASISKTAAASLLMALADDPALEFDIDTPLEDVLPWMGVYPGITTAQLISNTSGMPGDADFIRIGPINFGVHLCQVIPFEGFPFSDTLLACAQAIYQFRVPEVVPPGTQYRYGWSQWQLAGGVAEVVGGATWAQLLDEYISQPCGMENFQFGNMRPDAWTGSADSLTGQDNPGIAGGAIGTIRDILALATLQLHDGACGDTQVLSEEALARMREDVGSALGSQEHGTVGGFGYGPGWFITPTADGSTATLFTNGGAFGSVIWFDTQRQYAGAIAMADYTRQHSAKAIILAFEELIPMIEEIIDGAQ
jgi:CubicO group peptidase (beta-lactamase class C family)